MYAVGHKPSGVRPCSAGCHITHAEPRREALELADQSPSGQIWPAGN